MDDVVASRRASPSTLHGVIGPERAELTLADGVTLVADVWRPDGPGRFPVLLMRQPYGRTIASTIVFAHPAWYAARGYAVVIQDVRGCGDSGGIFDAMMHEAADGAATLDWVAELPFADGKIGTYGFSYQGATQYLALASGARRPDAMSPAMAPWSIRDDWAYEGNAFRYTTNVGWAAQMAWLRATREGDADLARELRRDADPARLSALLMARPEYSHLAAWRGDAAEYWAKLSPDQLLAGDPLGIPVLHLGGWSDYMLSGTLAADAAFRAVNAETSHLVIGPWAHIPWNRSGGSVDMGAAAEYSVDRAQLRFFDFYLKGQGERPQAVELFDVGRRRWLQFDAIPELPAQPFHLGSSGLAATLLTDGTLAAEAGPAVADRFVHDPSNPTPLIGGALGTPQGFVDRSRIDDRADVAVYTMAAFDTDVFVCGPISLELTVEASFADFDICAFLSLVQLDGRATVLSTGFARCVGTEQQIVTVTFTGVCATIPAGSALRLSLQGSGAPAFEVAHAEAPSGQSRPILITVRHGGDAHSQLLVPMGDVPA